MSLSIYKKESTHERFGLPTQVVLFLQDFQPSFGYRSCPYKNGKEYRELNFMQVLESFSDFDDGGFEEYIVVSDSALHLVSELTKIGSDSTRDRQDIAKTLELILKESGRVFDEK